MSERALLIGLGLVCAVALGAEPMEGADYAVLTPRVVPADARIEVVEFFYYGCAACARFEPAFEAWSRAVASDVNVVRMPVVDASPRWTALARLYFVLDAMQLTDTLHADAFRAIHQRRHDLTQRDVQLQWAQEHGVDRAKFSQARDSVQISQHLDSARDLAQRYQVRNTPSLIVDGHYLVSGAITGDLNTLLPIAEALIDKVRRERRAAK